MLSHTEENYLKALFKISMQSKDDEVGTNELALQLEVKPATVNNMLKKLREKNLVDYEKYGKITLTKAGNSSAIEVVRKHRLWETFLFEKLEFSWDEVHEVAEQLEHIQSAKLIERLDKMLNFPQFDPHGDPIPNSDGHLKKQHHKTLMEVPAGSTCKLVGVKDNTASFLRYVDQVGLKIQEEIKVISRQEFDHLLLIEVNGRQSSVSPKFAENIYVV